MARYMTLYDRVTQLYTEREFERTYERWCNELRKRAFVCPIDDNDLRIAAWGMEMEDESTVCFYPERLQRLNLEGYSVLPAASMFYRD
jgi:hypothetical protein